MPTKTSNSKSAWSAKDIYDMIFSTYGNAHVNANKARAKEASKYMIPYIPEKEIMLTTGRYNTGKISTNLLDSIYNASQRTGVPLDIALGLAGRESTLGIGRGFKKGKSVSGTDLYSNWQQIQTIPNNKAQMKKWNSLLGRTDLTDEDYDFKSGFLIRAQDSLENTRPLDENPIDNALKFYQTGKYNPGDSRHTQMVEDDAKVLMSDPAIQKWLKTKTGTQMKCGGRRKARLGLDIREGGVAIPIANNMFYIDGRKHEYGGVTMGPNNKNGVEVEGGEVVEMIDSNHPSVGRQFKAGGQQQTMRVFSSVPFLRGASPAELVLGGANPDAVFKAQEEFKDRNRINDDGTTYEMGGEGKPKSKRSRPVTGVLPYGYTIRNLYSVENPYRKGIKGNVAKMYDSRTLGAGVDVVSGHPELYKKAKSGKMTKKQADETAVIHLRKDDNAIRSNYADVYGKAAADTLSYGPRFLVAQARYQQGNVRKAWQPIHKAMAKGDAKALKKAVLQITPKDHAYRRKWIEGFKVYKMGGMIYEINGNVRNGLSLRHKALLGTERKVEGYGNTIIVGDDTFMLNEEGVYVPVGNVQINKQPKTVRGASGRRDIAYDRQGNRYQRRSDGSLIRVSPEKGNIAVSDTIRGVEVTAPDVTKTHSRKQINAATKTNYTKANPRRQKVEPNFEIGDQTVVNFLRNNNSKYNTQRSPIHSFTPAQKLGLSSYGWSTYNDPNKGYSFREDKAAVRAGQKSVDEIIGQDLSQVNFNSNQSESTPRGRGTKAITSKDTSQSSPTLRGTVDKITMDAWKASKTPKIDLSKTKMPTYNVSDLGSKESRAAKAKLNTSSTGGGTQPKEAPWIPQYNTITGRDWLGVGTNLAGHIASYFANNSLLKKAPMPTKPVSFQAAKLKTTHNINPELANINEVAQMNLSEVGRNTSSSSTSLARKQRIMNEARDAKNKLYGQKENIETQLINLDRRNRQDVYNRNIAAYNDWLDKTYVAKTNKMLDKQRNMMSLISGIPMAVNTMLGTIETRKSTNDMIRAIAAANPNVDGRLLGIGDYYTQKQSNGRTAVYNKNHKLVKYV